MNILIDAGVITPRSLNASIPIYIMRILTAIEIENRANYILLVNKKAYPYIKSHFPMFKLLIYEGKGFGLFFRYNPINIYFRYKLNKIITKNKIDCFLIPTDYPTYSLCKFKCRKIIVIHDLKAVKRINNSIKSMLINYSIYNKYKKSLETADSIIAISKYTKQDILANYPQISENKIHVIYNSVVLANFSICPNSQIPSKYILYVNTLHPYKNPLTLLKAFCKIRNQVKESLLFVGKETSHWNDVLLPFIKQEGIQDRVHRIENISNEELRWVYEHASLFVTSSLCEGFGYTPIEAAMCKCPVICSIQEALPDSTQGLLHYYQPAMDSDALAEEIIDVLLKNRPTIESLQYIAKVYSDYYSLEKQKGLIVNLLYCH